MNIISMMVSIFFTNYIITLIIHYLPIVRKRLWSTIIITIASGSSLVTYLIYLIDFIITSAYQGFDPYSFITIMGSIIGILIGYTASMMMLFRGFVGFKSRRTKKFEREVNNKNASSLPKNIVGIVFIICSIALLALGIISTINYDKSIILTVVGSYSFSAIFLGLALFLFITGNYKKTKDSSGNHFMFILIIDDQTLVYTQNITKEMTENICLGNIANTYFLDDFGYLITPNTKYYVKGIKVSRLDKETLDSIKMNLLDADLQDVITEFKRYEKKRITVDLDYKIIKSVNI